MGRALELIDILPGKPKRNEVGAPGKYYRTFCRTPWHGTTAFKRITHNPWNFKQSHPG